jgi:RNase P/RNase MRP subunit p29
MLLTTSALLATTAMGARPAVAQTPAPSERGIAGLVEVEATVVAVNERDRLITLRGPERTVTVHVPKKVPHLELIQPGDRVNARYYEALAVELEAPGTEPVGVKVKNAVDVAVTEPESGVVDSRQVSITSMVYIVNRGDNSVTFQGPDGYYRWVKIKDQRLQSRLQDLKYRDLVRITYTEALAVSLAPGKKPS